MSCTAVMYQPYSPYFPYQRPSAAAAAAASSPSVGGTGHVLTSGPLGMAVSAAQSPIIETKKHVGMPKIVDGLDGGSNGNSNGEYPHHHHSPSRVSVCSGGAHSPASSSAASTSKAADEVKSGTGHGGSSTGSGASEAADAQYMSANCVVFTYYTGDISSVVDEHFARALSQASSYSADAAKVTLKDTPPMTQRNFPPSFWNCNHQATATSVSSLCAMTSANHHELSYAADPYHTGALHASIHQNDPWHYTLSTHAQAANPYTHRPSMHELSYSTVSGVAPGNRFNPQYGSLLLQPSMRSTRLTPVSAACTSFDKSAAETWGTARYHDPLPHNLSHMDANYSATYGTMSAMTGLESQVQDASKDLYWF